VADGRAREGCGGRGGQRLEGGARRRLRKGDERAELLLLGVEDLSRKEDGAASGRQRKRGVAR